MLKKNMSYKLFNEAILNGVIGPFGIDNRNTKGRRLLRVLSQNILRVTNHILSG